MWGAKETKKKIHFFQRREGKGDLQQRNTKKGKGDPRTGLKDSVLGRRKGSIGKVLWEQSHSYKGQIKHPSKRKGGKSAPNEKKKEKLKVSGEQDSPYLGKKNLGSQMEKISRKEKGKKVKKQQLWQQESGK